MRLGHWVETRRSRSLRLREGWGRRWGEGILSVQVEVGLSRWTRLSTGGVARP